MSAVLTLTDIATARERIQAAGGTPKTFVCGPAKDADWAKGVAFYVGAALDGEHVIGTGKTLDAAVTHLLSEGAPRRRLAGTQAELGVVA